MCISHVHVLLSLKNPSAYIYILASMCWNVFYQNTIFSTLATRPNRSSRSSHKYMMIREKAKMARAQSTDKESPLGGDGSAVADMIGPASMMRSCDSSLNSSTGLSNALSTVENVSLVSGLRILALR